jgi:purine-binding chemotaxis protein CheW
VATAAVPWLLFRIGGHALALPLGAVAEVTACAPSRLVPQLALALGGVMNLRGEPLPVVDGARLLGIPFGGEHRHALVLEQGDARLGLLVEQVSRIDSRFRPGPPVQGAEALPGAPLVEWVHRERAIVGLVDRSALFDRAAALLAGSAPQEGVRECSTAF